MFSITGPSDGLYPHTDSTNKLISLLLYFPEKDWKEEYHGETSFYKMKGNISKNKKRKWSLLGKKNIHITDSELASEFDASYKTISKTRYIPNMLAGFVRNDKSWHGVGPITCPKGKIRRAFLINLRM